MKLFIISKNKNKYCEFIIFFFFFNLVVAHIFFYTLLPPKKIIRRGKEKICSQQAEVACSCPLFRNKRFMLDEMTKRNASKFAMFLEYKNPCSFFRFSICATLFFPLMNSLAWSRPQHSLGQKNKVA